MDVNIGKGITLKLDINALPANSLEHVIRIGLRNILMDSHAGIAKEDFADADAWRAASEAKALTKFDAMMAGDIRTASSGPRASAADPVGTEALRLAKEWAREIFRGYKKSGVGMDNIVKLATAWNMPHSTPEEIGAIMGEAISRRAAKPEVRAQAEAILKLADKSAAKMDLDI